MEVEPSLLTHQVQKFNHQRKVQSKSEEYICLKGLSICYPWSTIVVGLLFESRYTVRTLSDTVKFVLNSGRLGPLGR